jgi:hypothetical protein
MSKPAIEMLLPARIAVTVLGKRISLNRMNESELLMSKFHVIFAPFKWKSAKLRSNIIATTILIVCGCFVMELVFCKKTTVHFLLLFHVREVLNRVTNDEVVGLHSPKKS